MPRDPVFTKQIKNARSRLIGKSFYGSTITKVGVPIPARCNCPKLIPVQLANGHYAVIWKEEGKFLSPFESDNPKIERMLKHCRKMPEVCMGMGSGVMYLWLFPRNQNIKYAFCKIYYNDKSGRGDSYREVTWTKAARDRKEMREEEEQAAA